MLNTYLDYKFVFGPYQVYIVPKKNPNAIRIFRTKKIPSQSKTKKLAVINTRISNYLQCQKSTYGVDPMTKILLFGIC